MAYWLVGEHHGTRLRYRLGARLSTIGRDAESDLVLPSQTVSRVHAEIRVTGTEVDLTDLASLNGTRVNSKPIPPRTRIPVRSGDQIEIGHVLVHLSDQGESSSPVWAEDRVVSETGHLGSGETDGDRVELPKHDVRLFNFMLEADRLLFLDSDPAQHFEALLALLDRAIPADRIIVLLRNEDGELVQAAGRVAGACVREPLMISQAMIRTVLTQGSSFQTEDARADERFRHSESARRRDVRSAMAAPLQSGEEILGALYVDTLEPGGWPAHDLGVLAMLGRMLGAKISNARRVQEARELERTRHEREHVRIIQSWLLPQSLPPVPGYEFAARQSMCYGVGGDFYDVVHASPDRVRFTLGDVTDKGMGAALLMANVLTTIRVLCERQCSSAEIVEQVHRDLVRTTAPEVSATLFLGELDLRTHRLEYVSAGHPPTLLLARCGETRELRATGPPVGFALGVGFETRHVDLPQGSNLVIYSDGVTEAQCDGEFFEDEQFRRVVAECAGSSAGECIECIESRLEEFLGDRPQRDDVTLLVARRLEEA